MPTEDWENIFIKYGKECILIPYKFDIIIKINNKLNAKKDTEKYDDHETVRNYAGIKIMTLKDRCIENDKNENIQFNIVSR